MQRQSRKEFRHRPVLSAFDRLFEDLWEIVKKRYTRDDINKKDTSNIPVSSHSYASDCRLPSIQFFTIRNNESVEVNIAVRKLELRFYDKEGLDEFCLEISIDRELANPEKLQQDFSIFLATEKHLLDFIIETIWPHIDESLKKVEKKVRQVNQLNRETIPREDHPRYSLRARNLNKKPSNGREDRCKTHRL